MYRKAVVERSEFGLNFPCPDIGFAQGQTVPISIRRTSKKIPEFAEILRRYSKAYRLYLRDDGRSFYNPEA